MREREYGTETSPAQVMNDCFRGRYLESVEDGSWPTAVAREARSGRRPAASLVLHILSTKPQRDVSNISMGIR